jgi:hypothetical protein
MKESREFDKIETMDKPCYYVSWLESISYGPFESAEEAMAWIEEHTKQKNYQFKSHTLLHVMPEKPQPEQKPSKRQKRFLGKG